LKEFQEWCEKNEKLLNKIKFSYSKRGKQTGDIPFADAKGYIPMERLNLYQYLTRIQIIIYY
jgi:hypothetical protein